MSLQHFCPGLKLIRLQLLDTDLQVLFKSSSSSYLKHQFLSVFPLQNSSLLFLQFLFPALLLLVISGPYFLAWASVVLIGFPLSVCPHVDRLPGTAQSLALLPNPSLNPAHYFPEYLLSLSTCPHPATSSHPTIVLPADVTLGSYSRSSLFCFLWCTWNVLLTMWSDYAPPLFQILQ
jgi:hypothetical protein